MQGEPHDLAKTKLNRLDCVCWWGYQQRLFGRNNNSHR